MPEEIAIKIRKLIELKFDQNHRIHERIVIDKGFIQKLKINFDRSFVYYYF